MGTALIDRAMLSRVADSLYWMSRYIERAEHTARVLGVHLNLLLEEGEVDAPARWQRLLDGLQLPVPDCGLEDDQGLAFHLTFDPENPASIISCVAAARENARQVREQISTEMWLGLNRLFLTLRRTNPDSVWQQPQPFYMMVRDNTHLIQGISYATMVRGQGWQFMTLGSYLERTSAAAGLLKAHADTLALTHTLEPGIHFEWLGLLKGFTAFEAYCKVYTAELQAERIVEMLLFNPDFPHAIRFCMNQAHAALSAMQGRKAGRVLRLAGKLRSALDFDQVEDVYDAGLAEYLRNIHRQTALIHEAVYDTYINYPVDQALP